MKIGFLTPEYPHAKTGASGGIGTSIKNLATGLLAAGCSVRVLVYGQEYDGFFEDNGITVQQIKNVKIKGLSWFFTKKKLQKIINQLYHNQQIDLIESPDWTGITSFINTKCPIVIRLHGSDTYFCHLDNRPVKWINKYHERKALQDADGYLSVSHYTATLTNKLFGLSKSFTIIHNGINCHDFKKVYNDEGSVPVILYFGTLIRKKGLLELPLIFNKVIEKNPIAKLYLVGRDSGDVVSGNNSTWGMMQELFSKNALPNVTYFGVVSHDEITKFIEKATVCVFPSFAEALPVSWLEAMAMQKTIVASNIGWGKEVIVNGESGFLVHPKEHQYFAEAVITLLQNNNLRGQMGKNALKRTESIFDIKKIVQENIWFYKKIINDNYIS